MPAITAVGALTQNHIVIPKAVNELWKFLKGELTIGIRKKQ